MTWKVTFTIDVIQTFKSWAKDFAHVKQRNICVSDTGRCCLKYSLVQFNLVPHSPEHHIQEQDNWQCKPEHPGPYLPAINNCTIEDLSMLDTFPTPSSTTSADQHWMLKRKENWRRHSYWGWPDSNLVVWNSPELRFWLFQWLQRWETVHPFNFYL